MISSYPIQTWSAGTIEKLTIIDIILTIRFYTLLYTRLTRSAEHWLTRPKISFETDTDTFFETKYVRDRHRIFFRDQMFLRPIPRPFLRPNIFETYSETFSETKFFGDWDWDFFQNQIFWDQYWDFFKYDISFRIWLRIFTHMDISKL